MSAPLPHPCFAVSSTPTTFVPALQRRVAFHVVSDTEFSNVPASSGVRDILLHNPENGPAAIISSTTLISLLSRFPRADSLTLLYVQPGLSFETLPSSLPVFTNLVCLILRTSAGFVSKALFWVFQSMPGLRTLELTLPGRARSLERAYDSREPELTPPFSLESFIYQGIISVQACARIIECSSRSLKKLRILDLWDETVHPEVSSAHLQALSSALVQSAPRLRDFRLALPNNWGANATGRFLAHMEPVFAALAPRRIALLGISARADALVSAATRLIDCAPAATTIRHLRLECRMPGLYDAVDVPVAYLRLAPQLRTLRSLRLVGFARSGSSTDELLRYRLERRISRHGPK